MLCKGDNIEVNIKCARGCFITFECIVLWVTQTEQSYFCGLSITYMDESNKEIYRSLIKKLQSKEQRKKQKLKQGANISLRAKD